MAFCRTTIVALIVAVVGLPSPTGAFVERSAASGVRAASACRQPRVFASRMRTAMGLFDGFKDAFGSGSTDAKTALPSDRETPIDRWLGIDVASKNEEVIKQQQAEAASGDSAADSFVDSMDEGNYVTVSLSKPMGVVFEENEPDTGGVFVASLAAGGAAATDGTLVEGDQLVIVGDTLVTGRDFDACLDVIRNSAGDATRLIVFRGGVKNLYGNLGASEEWMQGFVASKTGAPAPAPAAAAPADEVSA